MRSIAEYIPSEPTPEGLAKAQASRAVAAKIAAIGLQDVWLPERTAELSDPEAPPPVNGPSEAPLQAVEQPWPVLPSAALYGLAGDVVRTIEPCSEADPAAILTQFLVGFGNMIGTAPHCRVEDSRHGLNLFAVIVGETSKARKGTSWGRVRRLLEPADPEWMVDRVTSGLSSSEGLIAEVADVEDSPVDRRLLVVQDEFASVLRIMARDGNTLSATLRSAWDSGNLRTLVKRDPLKATGAHISLVGHIVRQELLKYLSETESVNGFANRLLWICVRRSKCLPEGGGLPEDKLACLAQRITQTAKWAREHPGLLHREDAARKLWAAVYPKLSEGLPGLLGAATSRAEAQTLRLSALYAVLDQSAVIRVEHLNAALALWDYSFASARYIFGDATGNAVADRIREALKSADQDGMTRTEIRDLFSRHESSEKISRALAQLLALGIAERRMVASDGRRIEVWTATKAT